MSAGHYRYQAGREKRLSSLLSADALGTGKCIIVKPNTILSGAVMSLGTILIIVLILLLIGALPTWPHSRGWGYYPVGGIGLLLLILLILLVLGRI
jgi:Protein of unknown function (DUF3309)